MTRLMLALIAALLALTVAAVAQAQETCPSRASVEARFEAHGMAQVAAGMSQSREWLQLWCNPETGVWALVVTNGLTACFLGGGKSGCYGLRQPPNL